jgi:hypothetical protein
MAAAAKSTSRQRSDELASTQPGEGGGEVDGGVLFGGGRAHKRVDLFDAEDLDVAARALRVALDPRDGVA